MRKRDKFRHGSKRFSQFTLVGILNATVDFGVLNLFLWLAPTRNPWELALYNGIALVLANTNSYWWNTRWTFRSRAENDLRQVVLFALQVLVNIGVSSALFWVLIHPLLTDTDIPAYLVGNVAKLISVIVASTISYFILRYLVFSRKRWFGGRL